MTTVTVGELAQCLRQPGEDLTAAADRLRNWTKEGLIRAIGEKHPGTGRKRRYSAAAALDAVLLQVLADVIGMPAVKAAFAIAPKEFKHELEKARGFFSEDPSGLWRLVIGRGSSSEKWSAGAVKLDDIPKHVRRFGADTHHHVIVNVKPLFERLSKQLREAGTNG